MLNNLVRDLLIFVQDNRLSLPSFTFNNDIIAGDIANTMMPFSIDLCADESDGYLQIVIGDEYTNIPIDPNGLPQVSDDVKAVLTLYKNYLEELKKRLAS